MKQSATIDIEEFTTQTENILTIFRFLGQTWNQIRKEHTGAELVGILGIITVDILDAIAGIMSCSENDCPELCHEDWDYCKKHGEVEDLHITYHQSKKDK